MLVSVLCTEYCKLQILLTCVLVYSYRIIVVVVVAIVLLYQLTIRGIKLPRTQHTKSPTSTINKKNTMDFP